MKSKAEYGLRRKRAVKDAEDVDVTIVLDEDHSCGSASSTDTTTAQNADHRVDDLVARLRARSGNLNDHQFLACGAAAGLCEGSWSQLCLREILKRKRDEDYPAG